MLKNRELFDGFAERANAAIRGVNDICRLMGIKAEYDIRLADGYEETEESLQGWQDCLVVTKDGKSILPYLTCNDVIVWSDGFCEAVSVSR